MRFTLITALFALLAPASASAWTYCHELVSVSSTATGRSCAAVARRAMARNAAENGAEADAELRCLVQLEGGRTYEETCEEECADRNGEYVGFGLCGGGEVTASNTWWGPRVCSFNRRQGRARVTVEADCGCICDI